MKPGRAILTLLVGTLPALSQPQPQQPAAGTATDQSWTVEGQVVNALTKEPVPRAEVSLRKIQMPSPGGGRGPMPMPGQDPGASGVSGAVADQNGRFSITGTGDGPYTLTAQRQGFLTTRFGAKGRFTGPAVLRLVAGQKLTNLAVNMTPHGVIAGKAVDEFGEPMQGVQVQLLTQRPSGTPTGFPQWMPSNGANTNDLGEFRIAGVQPGKYLILASPSGRATALPPGSIKTEGPETAYVPTYYPGAIQADQAQRFDVTPGAQLTNLEVRLKKSPVYNVRGRVIGIDGNPAKNYSVSLNPKEMQMFGPRPMNQRRLPDGGFELSRVPPGAYTLVANVNDGRGLGGPDGASPMPGMPGMPGGPNRITASAEINVGSGDLDNIVLAPVPPLTVSGSIVYPGEKPATQRRMQIALMPSDFGFGGPQRPNIAVREDGGFSSATVAPGLYTVRLSPVPEGHYVSAIEMSGQPLPNNQLDLRNGSGAQLTVRLANDPGSITGTVTAVDGLPAALGSVVVLPADASKRLSGMNRMFQVLADGSFEVKNLPPGEYLVASFPVMDSTLYEDPDILKSWESKGTKVKVGKNASQNVSLKMITVE